MPDALVSIEDPGLYFCNFGGCGEDIRRALLMRLDAECTYLVVTEL